MVVILAIHLISRAYVLIISVSRCLMVVEASEHEVDSHWDFGHAKGRPVGV